MTIYSKQLIIFDKDGTITPSKGPMDPEMADLLLRLLENKKVAIISGSGFPLFEIQILRVFPHTAPNFRNLLLLPVSGTRLYVWKGTWVEQYSENLTPAEKEKIMTELLSAVKQAGLEQPRSYGELIEDRGSQITFSGLGQNAPLDLKSAWDPDRAKRSKIVALLQPRIPEFDIRIGGTTSVDVTRKGVNKGYGIRKLEDYLHLKLDDMLFVGDALFHGGNDYPARATGVDCIQVNGPEETKRLILNWLP